MYIGRKAHWPAPQTRLADRATCRPRIFNLASIRPSSIRGTALGRIYSSLINYAQPDHHDRVFTTEPSQLSFLQPSLSQKYLMMECLITESSRLILYDGEPLLPSHLRPSLSRPSPSRPSLHDRISTTETFRDHIFGTESLTTESLRPILLQLSLSQTSLSPPSLLRPGLSPPSLSQPSLPQPSPAIIILFIVGWALARHALARSLAKGRLL